MKKFLMATLIAATLAVVTPLCGYGAEHADHQASYRLLPQPGEKIPLDGNCYFTYRFSKSPKLGTCILQVEIFDKEGKRDTSYSVKGDADMPSMRGAHGTGPRDFSLSKKGIFLLPVQIEMPGDWEVRLTFRKNGKTVLRGSYQFDI